MPKATFFHLKEEKRKAVEKASLEEFSGYGYFIANISRIAKKSGISVGSFYQYFDDLNDLFMYIFSKIEQRKMAYIKTAVSEVKEDSFEACIRAMYAGGIRFVKDEPDSFTVMNVVNSVM